MQVTRIAKEAYQAGLGREIGVSRWIEIDQSRIDRFADCTGDRQYIHVDPARARRGPFGTTIAHGFLTLSLIPEMARDIPQMEGVTMSVNYGMNRMRFIAPVPVGSRIRGRFALTAFDELGPRDVQTTIAVTIEIEGAPKPAVVAEWLVRRHFGDGP
ncbi:MaoC family dehydratase [Aquabacter spiritensis]|uniref:Acyl dehydratase n=1 Tax=Aquabacter spiritensis TaxID=933073 RepID=A0A4R3LPN7_9HYPH|nr:MaoC family dehydratase [Aquabacter spiritensis]TCT00515.1 acyl dehydratase [Aquabacter spiritensis]